EVLQFTDGNVTIGTAPAVNNAPVITSGAQTGVVTEWAAGSTSEAQNVAHTATGAVTYSDADTLDTHSATFAAKASGYLGTFSINSASIDSAHSVGWSYSVSDSAIAYLNSGQSLTQQYDVSVNDGHGGIATQTVTITINGANEATTTTSTGHGKGNNKGA